MKSRYRARRERSDESDTPVVIDFRRSRRDQVICFAVGMSIAKRIAGALNQYEQRRLQLRERVKDIEAGR